MGSTLSLLAAVSVVLSALAILSIGIHPIESPATWLSWLMLALWNMLVFLQLGYESSLWCGLASTATYMLVALLVWLDHPSGSAGPPRGGRRRRLPPEAAFSYPPTQLTIMSIRV
ncbi:MAG TPA: hypothetical protein VHO23_02595 [Candidatus Paceibacterota bacterium]|nr:hypothetical protein [Candidatus Paceibacterota bacterium]